MSKIEGREIEVVPMCEDVPPCRVLFRDGKPVDEVITSRPARNDSYSMIDVPGPTNTGHRPVGRPRTRPVKAKPHAGEGHGWGRHTHVTVGRIRELQAHGATAQKIADILGCSEKTVYGRLRDERRRDPKIAAADAEARTCPSCGERKWPQNELCLTCGGGRKK